MQRLGELAETDAEKFQKMNAQIENAKQKIGQGLLPVFAEAIDGFSKMIGWIEKMAVKYAIFQVEMSNLNKQISKSMLELAGLLTGVVSDSAKKFFEEKAALYEREIILNKMTITQIKINELKKEKDLNRIAKNGADTREDTNKKSLEEQAAEHEAYVEKIKSGLATIGTFTANSIGELNSLYSEHSQNKIEILNQEKEAELEILDAEMQRELERLGLADMTAQERAAKELADLKKQLKKADTEEDKAALQEKIREAQKALEKTKIEEEFNKRKEAIEKAAAEKEKKLKLEAWDREKKLKIAETLIETPVAAMRAFSAMAGIPIVGPGLGAAAAAATTLLGAAKIAIIKGTPPPAEHGAFLPGNASGTLITAGERNKSEVILPLEDERGQEAIASAIGDTGGMTVNVNIENFYGEGEELSHRFIDEVDKGLSELKRRGESRVL